MDAFDFVVESFDALRHKTNVHPMTHTHTHTHTLSLTKLIDV